MWVGVRLTDADCADASQTDRLLLVRLPSPRVSQSFEMRHERRRQAQGSRDQASKRMSPQRR